MSKVIVVTGAGAGLGKHLAQRFAAEGEQVVLLGRTAAKVEAVAAAIGERALAFVCDVAEPASVRAAFARIARRHPRIDVLINNAAIFEPALVAEASDAHVLDTVGVNLTGAVFCARAAIPLMGRGAQIINVSSESVVMPYAHLAVYQAAKAGLERFSLSLLQELEPAGIRVTLVRSGQMYEHGKGWDVDPDAIQRFAQANLEAGLDHKNRPHSHYGSATGVFRALIDLPADVQVAMVQTHGR